MDEKSKKKKKLKQKQKQRQKQNQTVIVNVNSGKSTRMPSKPHNSRVQIPPPIHKVYASPIHDLTPQMFNKEGKQASQPTLAEQIEKYLKGQEQAKQGNVLGDIPKSLTNTPKQSSEMAIQTDKTGGPGRKKGSKNAPKIFAVPVDEANVVASQSITEKSSGYSEGNGPGERIIIPRKFQPETTSLRVPEDDSINTNPNIFTHPSQTDEPNFGLFKLFTPAKEKKPKKTLKKNKNLIIEEEEEINEL